jgi:putative hydrolase of the HAD superfamily
MIKAVYFDAGETLIHRNPSLVSITARLLKKGGHRVTTKLLEQVIQETASSMKNIVEKGVMSDSEKWDHFMRRVFFRLKIIDDKALEAIKKRLKEGTSFRMYAEVPQVLKELRRKHMILGVISNASKHLEGILKRAGLKDCFDHIIVSEVVGVEKPDKKIFSMALKSSGVKRDEFLFVGDNYIADVMGATQAELSAIWLARPTKNAQFSFSGAAVKKAIRIRNLRQLIKYMKKEKML